MKILRVGLSLGRLIQPKPWKTERFTPELPFLDDNKEVMTIFYMITFYEIRTLAVGKNHPLHNLTHVKIALAALAELNREIFFFCCFFILFILFFHSFERYD